MIPERIFPKIRKLIDTSGAQTETRLIGRKTGNGSIKRLKYFQPFVLMAV
jgi:hypothetical protein